MNEAGHTLLGRLKDLVWFGEVGKPDLTGAKFLKTWKQAARSCSALKWENLTLEERNKLTEFLSIHHPKRDSHWNELVDEVKEHLDPLIEERTTAVIEHENLPGDFLATVRWDLLGVIMELQFTDLVAPAFYADLGQWYLAGRFPSGYEGEYPGGRWIIY